VEDVQGRRFVWDQGKTAEELQAKETAREAKPQAAPHQLSERQPMGFGKVVLAVFMGNALTGVIAWFIWQIVK